MFPKEQYIRAGAAIFWVELTPSRILYTAAATPVKTKIWRRKTKFITICITRSLIKCFWTTTKMCCSFQYNSSLMADVWILFVQLCPPTQSRGAGGLGGAALHTHTAEGGTRLWNRGLFGERPQARFTTALGEQNNLEGGARKKQTTSCTRQLEN